LIGPLTLLRRASNCYERRLAAVTATQWPMASVSTQLDAFRAPGALGVVVRHFDGDIDALQFLGFRVGDLLLHGWDLARSCGGDNSFDDDLVRAVWDVYHPTLSGSHAGAGFGGGSTGLVSDDAPFAVRLLDLTGRRR
jgi:hypothetical protein